MSLIRHWYGTSNYSYGNDQDILVLHTTEGWGESPNGMYDCIKYFQGNVGASSHVAIDNYHPGEICEGVSRGNGSWTQCDQNYRAISAEQCGYAAWTQSTWLNQKEPLLRNAAAWLAEEHLITGIPLTELTESNSRSQPGVTYHMRLGSGGCGHGDPGNGYPLGTVLQWAREIAGGAPVTPPAEEKPEEDEDVPYFYIPSKATSAESVHISMTGWWSTVGLVIDAGGVNGRAHLRVAMLTAAQPDPDRWDVVNIYGDENGHNKAVIRPPNNANGTPRYFTGLRIDRQDDTPVTLVIDVGK